MSKYHNDRKNGFDRRKEARRYAELLLLERAGKISGISTQVKFELIPKQYYKGKFAERPVYYYADFVYTEDGEVVVEDVKGFKTKDYILKRKLMLQRYGIRIRET